MLVMWLSGLNAVERTQHADASFTVAAVVGDGLVSMFQTAQRVRVLQDARHEIRVVERVRGSHRGLTVRRRAVGTE